MDHDVWKRLGRIDRTLVTIVAKLDAVLGAQKTERMEITKMGQNFDDMKTELAGEGDALKSLFILIDGLATKAEQAAAAQAAGDDAALADFVAQVRADKVAIAQKVLENTPAAPPPAPPVS